MAGESHVRPSCWGRFHSEATARPGASQEESESCDILCFNRSFWDSAGFPAENGKLWASRYFQNSLLNLDLLCTWLCFMFELYSLSLCRSSGPPCSIPSYRTWFCTHVWTFFCFHHVFPSHFSAPRIEGFIDFIIAPYYTPLAELLPEALLLEDIRKQTQS